MLLVYFVILAVPLGYLLGGKLKNYGEHPLKWLLAPCAAFLLEACFGLIGRITGLPARIWLPWAVIGEYLLLALFILANRRRRGMGLLGAATLINFTVIAANGFRMPVSPLVYENPAMEGLVRRIQAGELHEYVLVDWDGPLWFLGDTIPIGNGLASIGDLLMALGVLVLILHLMDARPFRSRNIAKDRA